MAQAGSGLDQGGIGGYLEQPDPAEGLCDGRFADCGGFQAGAGLRLHPQQGYLFERLGKLFGTGAGAKVSIVLLTSALFALGHYSNLGLPGVEQAMITGLTFGTIFAITGRIWMVMCAHAAFDLAAVAIIYWNLEATVAHLVFK